MELPPGCEVGPPTSPRTFHTPNVVTSVGVPEVDPSIVTRDSEQLTLPSTFQDSQELNSDINALEGVKSNICLVGAAPFALLWMQGTPCYLLQTCPECPDTVSDTVPSSHLSASASTSVAPSLHSSTNLTEEEPSLFAQVIPPEYQGFNDIFLKADVLPLSPHQPYDMKIELESDTLLLVGLVYSMSELELCALHEYLDEMLGK